MCLSFKSAQDKPSFEIVALEKASGCATTGSASKASARAARTLEQSAKERAHAMSESIYRPRKGSIAERGIDAVRRSGGLSAGDLAVASNCDPKKVSANFLIAVDKGALLKTKVAGRVFYVLGENVIAPRPAITLIRLSSQANPYNRPPRVSSVFELGDISAREAAEAKA